MSIFDNRNDFPYTDYHTFNLDYIVKKVNELVEYVRTKTGIPKESADIFYIPKCDGNDPDTGNIKIDIGMEKDNNDCENYMLRPFSTDTQVNDRGTISFDGSESQSVSPVVYLKNGLLKGVKMWFDGMTKTLHLQGKGEDYNAINVKGLSNHTVRITGTAEPTESTDTVNLAYLGSNYYDTEGTRLLVENAVNDIPMYRAEEITDSSALSRGEIITEIESRLPQVEGLMETTYVVNNEQYLHPRYVTGSNYYAMRWRVGLGAEPVATDGYVGFVPSSGTAFGACVMSTTSDGTGWGLAWHNDGVDCYIENKLTPTTEGVFRYPTEFRLGWAGHPMKIRGCDTPTVNTDCANKQYVDEQVQHLTNIIANLENRLNNIR